MKLVTPEMTKISKSLTEAQKSGNRSQMAKLNDERRALMRRAKASPVGIASNLLSMPFYIGFFWALGSSVFFPEKLGLTGDPSFLWMTSVYNPDPYFVVPLVTSLMTYLFVRKMAQVASINESTPLLIRKARAFMPFIPFFSTLFMALFPANFNLYLLVIAIFNYFFAILTTGKHFNRLNGIPLALPDTELWKNLQDQKLIPLDKDSAKLRRFATGIRHKTVLFSQPPVVGENGPVGAEHLMTPAVLKAHEMNLKTVFNTQVTYKQPKRGKIGTIGTA